MNDKPPVPQGHPFGRLLGLHLERPQDGVCHASVQTREEHINPRGFVHGGVLFSLADTSMGAALWTLLAPSETCATIEIKMNFLRPVVSGSVRCETRVLRRGRTTAVLESRLHREESLVAIALGTYAIFPKGQPPQEVPTP